MAVDEYGFDYDKYWYNDDNEPFHKVTVIGIAVFMIIVLITLIVLGVTGQMEPSKSNFNDGSTKIIWFFRPGCGYCDRMEPAWDEFMKHKPSGLIAEKINTIENKEMADRFGVNGVPFIVKISSVGQIVYSGDRSTEDLLRFATS